MIYLTIEDLELAIQSQVINEILEDDLTKLDALELQVLGEIGNYISALYDWELEKSKSGTARNFGIVKLASELMAYKIFSLSPASRLTDGRAELEIQKYKSNKKYLDDIARQNIKIDLERRKNPDETLISFRRVYGGEKRQY